ncbi:hypothetical protein [Streptomyces sp. NPDC059278]|uniref:hypothetical protein n=1 Tax=Streptomyces sp. NPDC059278 TaxID=3346801 RepID=UPI0036A512F9
MPMPVHRFKWDILERTFWNITLFTVSLGITEVTPLDKWWAAPIGHPGTASTLPATSDPAGNIALVLPPPQ